MINSKKKIVILGGGTNAYISNHLSLSAPAYGKTALFLEKSFKDNPSNDMSVQLILTKMSDPSNKEAPDTPEEVSAIVDKLVADPAVRVIVFNVAMVDYKPTALLEESSGLKEVFEDEWNNIKNEGDFGKYKGRLSTSEHPEITLELSVQDKIIQKIRKTRKDIFLVGFKTTCGSSKEEQYNKGLKLCKEASANIVFVNDVDKERITKLKDLVELRENFSSILVDKYKQAYAEQQENFLVRPIQEYIENLQNNGIVTPEESSYWYNTREEALDNLVQMTLERTNLTFGKSSVVEGDRIPWLKHAPTDRFHRYALISNPAIPSAFRDVFEYVRNKGGWHEGPTGKTSGHFGIKINEYESICSIRKQNYNLIEKVGMVRVITDDPENKYGFRDYFKASKDANEVIAFGAKPSVGDVTQRRLFKDYSQYDCIIHFHSTIRKDSDVAVAKQFPFECGSLQCGINTSNYMKEHTLSDGSKIHCVHLEKHGPNIMFTKDTNPLLLIEFLATNWNINLKTNGLLGE